MPKLAITGKGGVGKTTLAALLAHTYTEQGRKVIAIDADPAPNLAFALGFPLEAIGEVVPITEMGELITERTGAEPGSIGGYFKLNPKVDDIPERFSITSRGVKLLIMGGVKKGGAGCLCPENALLRALVHHLLLERMEVVIMDMEAGIEHLGRATAQAVDALLIVVEPGLRSLHTAKLIRRLASDIGLERVYVVGNRVRSAADREFVRENLPGQCIIGFLSESSKAIEAEKTGVPLFELDPQMVAEAKAIVASLPI